VSCPEDAEETMPDWRVLSVAAVAVLLLEPRATIGPESEPFGEVVNGVLPNVVDISVKGKKIALRS
jgi:hypothetical protein